MDLSRPLLVAEYRLVSQFNELRDRILSTATQDQLAKPLGCWALPDDRRLPLAFMGRSLGALLETPFVDLLSTPGVGQKKITSLITLLERAEVAMQHRGAGEQQPAHDSALLAESSPTELRQFDPSLVSELMWERWRDCVKRYHLEDETLGRMAPSLDRLPRVLWSTPLNAYCDLTLSQIRELKTHGEKRVAAVLEVFFELHKALADLGSPGNLAVRVQPRLVDQVESWLLAVMHKSELPSPAELNRHLIVPLSSQIHNDLGEFVGGLVDDRLQLSGRESSVRQTARTLGLTRARIYQLLADAAQVMAIRWPEGQFLMTFLSGRIRAEPNADSNYQSFFAAMELLFPHRRGQPVDLEAQATALLELEDQRRAG